MLVPDNLYLGEINVPVRCSIVYVGVYISTTKYSTEGTNTVCEKLHKLININHNFGLQFRGLNPLPIERIRVILPFGLYALSGANS